MKSFLTKEKRMAFEQDNFLGRSSSSDLSAEIDALKDRALFRDGTKSMTGNLGLGGNAVLAVKDVQLNAVVTGATPATGINIYTKADNILYKKTAGGVESAVGGGGGNVSGVGASLVGNLPQFDNLVSDQISDSGVKSSEVLRNLSGIGLAGNLCEFDSTITTITDSGVAVGSLVVGPGSSTDDAVARFDGVTGKLLHNSTLTLSDVGVLSTSSGDLELDSTTNLVKISADAQITGDLVVQGTTTSTESEQVQISANYLNNNTDYTNTVAQTGGLTIRIRGTATADTQNGNFDAGAAGVANPRVITTGSGTFTTSDIIAIDGANNPSNNGLYEVLSHVTTSLSVRGIGLTGTVEDFTQNQFITDATGSATITKVLVSVIRADTTGIWERGVGNTTPITYTTFGGGTGDVIGPASSTDNHLTLFSGGTGKLIKQATSFSLDDSVPGKQVFKKDTTPCMTPLMDFDNCFYGQNAGDATVGSLTNQSNTAVGSTSFVSNVGGERNTCVGAGTMPSGLGDDNTCIGAQAGTSLVGVLGIKGQNNTFVGRGAGIQVVSGSDNLLLGAGGGSALTLTDSGNLMLDNDGVAGDNTTTRIGTSQTSAFMAGIHNVVPSGANEQVVINSSGELGSYTYGAVQKSRSSNQNTSGSYTDITFTDTDIETNTNLLSASGNTDIDVEADGLIEVSFQCICDPPNDDEVVFQAQIQLNGSVATLGQITQNIYQAASDKEDWSMFNRTILLECSAGDTLGVQVRDQSGGSIQLKGGATIFTAKYLGSV